MTREQLIAALQEIASGISAELNRPGDNDDRYRALKRAERLAREALNKAGA